MSVRLIATVLVCSLSFISAVSARADSQSRVASTTVQEVARETTLTDVAIIAVLIAATVTAYKASGRPCACPSDTARNGSACGGRSAWNRPGGAKPLCFAKDVTPGMISAYRATKAVPSIR